MSHPKLLICLNYQCRVARRRHWGWGGG